MLLTHLGRLHRAELLLEESVRIRTAVYGPHHHLTHCSKQNLEFVSQKKRRMEKLERELQSAMNSERSGKLDEEDKADIPAYEIPPLMNLPKQI